MVALNLYHKLSFGQLHARNPAIIEFAQKLGRGPNSLAMKLCNFASLDPVLRLRRIKGLEGASSLDRSIWTEYHANLQESVPAGESAVCALFGVTEKNSLEVLPQQGVRIRKRPSDGTTETVRTAKFRRGQDYFRQVVLNNFGGRCGITGLGIRELLVASHMLPWSKYPDQRLEVNNGLCLSRLHDAAFDEGFITFDDSLRLMLSKSLKQHLPQPVVVENFGNYEGEALRLPEDAIPPDLSHLASHRKAVFKSQAA